MKTRLFPKVNHQQRDHENSIYTAKVHSRMGIIFLFLMVSGFTQTLLAHRDSDIDNFIECEWNKEALSDSNIEVNCNDLYHLYESTVGFRDESTDQFNLGALNTFKLGTGDSRYKNLKLVANILKDYDVIAVSEVQTSSSEEFTSNINLVDNPQLDFKKYYHFPGYIELLLELKKINSSWSLIVSPVAQSNTQELLGFYYKADKASLVSSKYCEKYSKKIKNQNLDVPNLDKSYGCLLDIEQDENDISRVPFSARFMAGEGFDFQYLSHHARFQGPLPVSGRCEFECLEKTSQFLNKFHPEGEFLGVLNNKALGYLKYHLDFLQLKKDESYALLEEYDSLIKFKAAKPRVYNEMLKVKNLLFEKISDAVNELWQSSFKDQVSSSDKNKIIKYLERLFKDVKDYEEYKAFVKDKNYKDFIEAVLETSEVFEAVYVRKKIWTSPDKIARFFETSLILEEMGKVFDSEKDSDIILGGDFNLEGSSNEYFWNYFKENNRYSSLGIDSPTSISDRNGPGSSYDHFMYDENNSLEECRPEEATTLDFIEDSNLWEGFESYFINSKSELKELSKLEEERISKIFYVSRQGDLLSTQDITESTGYTSCWTGESLSGKSLLEIWTTNFECNVLNQYLNGPDNYRLYTDLIGDHFPIEMSCNSLRDLD